MKKPKIDAIFPLTYMQQGLLFHHLSNENDQGFLNVECTLKGSLNIEFFEAAWNETVERHAVLRTTVHWKNLEKPVAIVHQEKKVNLEYLDWVEFSPDAKKEKWEELLNSARTAGVDFEKGPLLNLKLIDFGQNEFGLLWPNHHLLIDGWSSQVVLDDFLSLYNALIKNENLTLESLPSLKSYYNWVGKKDKSQASRFWASYFENFEHAPQFDNTTDPMGAVESVMSAIQFSGTETNSLKKLARETKVTLNTLIQGAWSFLLGRYFGVDDITYGTTVSGRSGGFPGIERLTGMFMSVQPVRSLIKKNEDVLHWFQNIQKRQQEGRQFEHVNLDEIASFIDWPEAKPLFDSLLIFENFPQSLSESRVLELKDFKSGVTSTYPVTMVVIPGKEMKFALSVKSAAVDEKSLSWILENWKKLIRSLISEQPLSFERLDSEIPVFENTNKPLAVDSPNRPKYVAPRNETELQLVRIWESMFGTHSIGIDDDFFSLGGKSLMAARMFMILAKEMNVQLPPTTLLEHPTIAAISQLINEGGENSISTFQNLVPVRARGNKPALFCVHAGGGHVFFYNLLAKYLNGERPIYALQPSGIFGKESMHASIEQMAKAYADEIRSVQPKGPYNLMVYCFSTAVGLEMSKALKADGSETNLIVMDTMAEQEHLITQTRMTMRVLGFFKRLSKNPIQVLNVMFADRYNRYVKPFLVRLTGSVEEKNTEMMSQHLTKIYNKYKWRPHKDEVKLVLTEKANNRFNKEYIRSWEEIALEGVEVIETVGDHRTLFIEPDVQEVAETIDGCLL